MRISAANELKRSKYRLLGLVGQGQFGRVYCASHRKTGQLYALKELDKDRFPTNKFLRELHFLVSLQHPNIVTCYGLEHLANSRYLVMDYCEGGTLRQLMPGEVQLPPSESLKLILDVLQGLELAHQQGIVHCDIKPENILLAMRPTGWTARISDFGIARFSSMVLTDEWSNTGSPAYMSPERFYGQYSVASDIYSVGVLLFELLAGHRPFSGTPGELMSAHLNQPLQIPATIPAPLQDIIRKALQKLQARRYRSAAAMQAAVEAAIAQLSPTILSPACVKVAPPSSPCDSVWQQPLRGPVQQLVVQTGKVTATGGDRLWWATGTTLYQQAFANDLLAPELPDTLPPLSAIACPAPIQSFGVSALGVLAQTAAGIYHIPLAAATAASLTHAVEQPLVPLHAPGRVAFAPTGQWLVVAPTDDDGRNRKLAFWRVRHEGQQVTSEPIAQLQRQPRQIWHLLALDSRHLAVFSHLRSPQAKAPVGTLLEIFSRRGNFLGQLKLPLLLRSPVLTPMPYQLLALEATETPSFLLVTLKPLRVQRVPTDRHWDYLGSNTWGHTLASADGQIALFDPYGEAVGRLTGPQALTAIAPVGQGGVVLASWQGRQGHLQALDFRQVEAVEIIF